MTAAESGGVARVVRVVHARGSLSRTEIADSLGLNRSTVATIIANLVNGGLVEEKSGVAGSVGRPSLTVTATPTAMATIGCDLRENHTSLLAWGLGGRELGRWEQPHIGALGDPVAAATRVVSGVGELVASLPEVRRWAGIGVAIPGVIDPRRDDEGWVVRRATSLGWVDVPFGSILTRALGDLSTSLPSIGPVTLGNDASLGAIAEWSRGVGRGSRVMLFVSGGIGVGGALVVDGELLTGARGFAGEIGHMRFDPDGAECQCGATGCWETTVGSRAIVRMGGGDPTRDTPEDIYRAAAGGNERARTSSTSAAKALGAGLASLVNLVDPDTAVLGGHFADLLAEYRFTIVEGLRATISRNDPAVSVVPPALGQDSIIVGSAELAFQTGLQFLKGILPLSGDPHA